MRAALSRRRFLGAGVATIGAAALSSACGSDDGKTTLTIMGNHPSEITDADVAGFAKKHPDIKLKFVAVTPTLLTAMFAAGDPPDIVRDQGVPNTPYLVARGLAENLDPYFAKSTILAPEKLAAVDDTWRYDGKEQGKGPRYGLAKDYSQDAMFWSNTRVFEKAGVDLPSTTEPISYDEQLDLAKRLTKRKGVQYSAYGLDPTFDVSLTAGIINMVTSAGGSIFNDDFSEVDFSAPEPVSALNWYLQYAAAKVGPTAARPLSAGAWPTFDADQLAMMGYGYWFSGMIAGDPKIQDHVTFHPAAQFGKTRVSPCFSATGHWIPKRAKHKEEAWAFFEWYFGEQPAIDRAKSGWGLPGISAMNSDLPKEKKYQKQALEVQQREFEHYSVLKFSPYISVNAIDAAISKELVKGLDNGSSAGKLADAVNHTLNPLLKLGKDLIT
ncbi:MAG TPA: extracellular solute-binding protein [Mycobacteriales bacterium]|nr:extracellular solute-binding protein [Mycobacteriales bacterium]